MKNIFKNNKLTINELVLWKRNPLINPRTNKIIKENKETFLFLSKAYDENKIEVDNIINSTQSETANIINSNKIIIENITQPKYQDNSEIENNLLLCIDDRDPISMNIFWIEKNGKKIVIYPKKSFSELIFYTDSSNLFRCLERESLIYMKSYNINLHPVTYDVIPQIIFDNIDTIDLNSLEEIKTIDDTAIEVFQYFSKLSIFIDHEWFINLSKSELIKFNYELKDFWSHNFTPEQRLEISLNPILIKTNNDLENEDKNIIIKYLLNEIKQILLCENEEYKYMINYIVLGALGIVIPEIKKLYPDFSFSFC